jgi:hypothetical protein
MNTITVTSKTHGTFKPIVDDDTLVRLKKLGGKWCVVIKRGNPYFQKRLPGNKLVELHRWIMGEPEGLYVDHISRDTLDNRRSNLRAVKNSTNIRNGRVRSNNTSSVTGVSRRVNRPNWYASIRVDYRTISLGSFKTFEEAVEARKQAEKKYFGV